MTAAYYVKRKAEDLRIGHSFVDWAFPTDGIYGRPARITSIRTVDLVTDELRVDLDDGRKFRFLPEMEVVVMEVA